MTQEFGHWFKCLSLCKNESSSTLLNPASNLGKWCCFARIFSPSLARWKRCKERIIKDELLLFCNLGGAFKFKEVIAAGYLGLVYFCYFCFACRGIVCWGGVSGECWNKSCFGTGLLVEMFALLRQKPCQVNPFCPFDPEALRSSSRRSTGIQCSQKTESKVYTVDTILCVHISQKRKQVKPGP